MQVVSFRWCQDVRWCPGLRWVVNHLALPFLWVLRSSVFIKQMEQRSAQYPPAIKYFDWALVGSLGVHYWVINVYFCRCVDRLVFLNQRCASLHQPVLPHLLSKLLLFLLNRGWVVGVTRAVITLIKRDFMRCSRGNTCIPDLIILPNFQSGYCNAFCSFSILAT